MSAGRLWGGLVLAILLASGRAEATAPSTFGHGARSAALVRADVADADPAGAPVQNAALAAAPGARVRLGYGYGLLDLRIDDRRADVADVSGLDLGVQVGFRLPASFFLGFALAAHVPDAQIAKIGFRPGTEPQFVRYEAALQRATFDLALALRRGPFALGIGAALALDMGGEGTRFELGQDAEGTYADAASDISLAYRAAPIVGLAVDLGRVAFGASLRGGLGVSVAVDSDVRIALAENPLNGTTQVRVRGVSGYDPARFVFGARAKVGSGFSVLGSIEWQGYSDAPPPVADVSLDVALGTSPGRTEVRFVAPNFRDVLVPRLGVEWTTGRWAVRAGYALSPSPVPPQRGFTSYADATRHAVGLGGGVGLGRVWGVDLRADLAAQVSFLAERAEEKASPALPNARYVVSGRVVHGALSVEAAFR
ncbi:hypothetical protein [Polyangium jinanense]|uniref:Outer membrane protein beta-barrel domain-containing protein n=1 Tax=Polyangium jinanense TaxID=2829994 RepID=A0A9X3X270_9BACT|nr:hypothetical protein [Polyangium jinanense]MDC3955722.1 hypothetical protein [Polyangium jinanense]MDC3982364.1 hypothetical protein [Polyangium jinanense]